jgi:hypothetical protein
MNSIEPENLSALADDIEKHSNFCHEQLDLITGVLFKLEDYQLWHADFQFLADAFQSIADETDQGDPEPCDFLPSLKAALGIKYARHVGRA